MAKKVLLDDAMKFICSLSTKPEEIRSALETDLATKKLSVSELIDFAGSGISYKRRQKPSVVFARIVLFTSLMRHTDFVD